MKHVTLRQTLLAMAVGCAASYAQAEETIVVQAASEAFTPGGDTPPPAYLDGQVAHGGRLGMLGEQRAMDVPFNVISFTSKLVEDQQARTVADVVRNDAGVQNVQGYGNFQETYRIRTASRSSKAPTRWSTARPPPAWAALSTLSRNMPTPCRSPGLASITPQHVRRALRWMPGDVSATRISSACA